MLFFFSSRRRHTRFDCDWSSDVCSSDLRIGAIPLVAVGGLTLERLPGVFAAGADVAAVVTDIVRHVNPRARVREWLSAAPAARGGGPVRAGPTPVASSRGPRPRSGTACFRA